MSVVCLYRFDNGIVFASDGLSSDHEGRAVGYVTKIYPVPHLRCVFTHAGAGRIGVVMLDLINRGLAGVVFDSFDALMNEFIPLCQEAHRTNIAMALSTVSLDKMEAYTKATFVIGGWSDAEQKFTAWKTSSYDKEVFASTDGDEKIVVPAWTLQPIDGIYTSVWPGTALAEKFGIGGAMPALDHLARIVCACRADSAIKDDGGYCAGGYLQMTVLERAKITSWIAHRWPDKIGELVDPSAGDPMPAFPVSIR